MNTPASVLARQPAKPFSDVAIGQSFECNGNVWTKRSTKTAVGVWPACLPAWSYFRAKDICRAEDICRA